MKALLIIDMQRGSFIPYSLRYDTFGVIERINRLSKNFREQGDKVIFIQHDGSKENVFIPGSEDWKMLPELTLEKDDLTVSKTANDSFYKSELQTLLEKLNITELYFSGCATDFCVDATVKSALTKEYSITVLSDAHTAANRPHIDAQTVIKHYNWLWADLTPTPSKIKVISTEDFFKLKN
jgi:nicotinamidase-related amidase